jgi:hypothetical protein
MRTVNGYRRDEELSETMAMLGVVVEGNLITNRGQQQPKFFCFVFEKVSFDFRRFATRLGHCVALFSNT